MSNPISHTGLSGLETNSVSGTPMPQRSPGRPPLTNLNGNAAIAPGFSGYGMSAGLKVSNPPGTTTIGSTDVDLRSRGIPKVNYSKLMF
jgi:E3 ubiquitin-protein ligase CCNP1IP1